MTICSVLSIPLSFFFSTLWVPVVCFRCGALQFDRCADMIRSGFMVWHVMKWRKSYAKWMRIQHQPTSNGHSTIQPKQLICHKMDLRSIQEPHLGCLIHQSRFVFNYPFSIYRLILYTNTRIFPYSSPTKCAQQL